MPHAAYFDLTKKENSAIKTNVAPDEIKSISGQSFKNTVPRHCEKVVEVLQDGPLSFTRLHKELCKRTGCSVSKSTLTKCIHYLSYIKNISVKKIDGSVGNEISISLNNDSFVKWIDKERKYFTTGENQQDTNHNIEMWNYVEQLRSIDNFIDTLLSDFINQLYIYSNSVDRQVAAEEFNMYMRYQLMPTMHHLTELVRPPLRLSEETRNKLIRLHSFSLHLDIMQSEKQMQESEIDKEIGSIYLNRVDSSKTILQRSSKKRAKGD